MLSKVRELYSFLGAKKVGKRSIRGKKRVSVLTLFVCDEKIGQERKGKVEKLE